MTHADYKTTHHETKGRPAQHARIWLKSRHEKPFAVEVGRWDSVED